ncbi:c-type cytochrome [Pelagibius sp.]|uniref:c-type cytochrome n=1 Tax=Pelagibius sp. TaxID=1931238 RepID=UPI003B51094D
MPSFRSKALVIAAALSLAGPAPAAAASGDADAAKGLIVQHCSDCHAVPGHANEGTPALDAPSFQAIADDPETYSEARLRGFLRQPHWPMGQFQLSPSDIDNIVAYLKAL